MGPSKSCLSEKEESAKGLVLRRGANVLPDSQMGEKGLDFGTAHLHHADAIYCGTR